jgi:hypothetical protein
VTDFDNVRSYTCKDKQEFVIRGLAKFAVEEGPVNENNSGKVLLTILYYNML